LKDSYKHKGKRKRLVDSLKEKGIRQTEVLQAMLEVPRHFFFPSDFEDEAYEDKAFPIDSGQTISQPYTVAFQSQLLNVRKGDKVLEIGTGSGYQAAILHSMGCEVYTIERHELLFKKAQHLFKELGMRLNGYCGDGTTGLKQFAPYRGIIVTAAAPEVSNDLLLQLAPNGTLVIPIGGREDQEMMVCTRSVDNKIKCGRHGRFKFVPLIGEKGWKE
jgi:protein-L-isoaspartate(D-aspartate) O-methyltransferase